MRGAGRQRGTGRRAKVEWVGDYATAEAVLRHRALHEVTFKGMTPLLGPVIVTLHGAAHRERRTVAARLFVSALLRDYERDVIPTIAAAVLVGRTGAADMVALVQEIAGRVAARLIGLDGVTDAAAVGEAVGYLNALVGGAAVARQSHAETVLRREQAPVHFRARFIAPAVARRRDLVAAYRAGALDAAALPNDLLTLLLLHGTDERAVAGEAIFFAVAAIETTANLVPHMLHEAWAFVAAQPDAAFLHRTAAESLRLHPAIPTIFRQAAARVEIADRVFEPGRVVGVRVSDANHDTAVFGADAALFNPFRAVPPKVRRAGLSFGGGPHLCLGRELALGDQFDTPAEADAWGEAVGIALALLRAGARPDPAQPVPPLSPFARDVYAAYPILLG